MCSERVRVLVTGASGFVGKALVARLVARGHAVRALARPTSQVGDLVRLGAELVPGDLAGAGALASALDGCEAVFHVAGAVKALDGDALVRVNAEGTRNVAQACAARPRPPVLVYVSSLAAAGPARGGRPLTEEDAPAPVSAYGRSKLGGEEAVREVAGAVPVTIVRPPIVYGPGDKELLPPLLKMARIGVVLRAGFGAKRYSLVHVSDLCDGLVAVAERGRRARAAGPEGVYYLDGGAVHTWDEIARAVCAALGRRAAVLPIPEVVGYAAAAGASLRAAVTGKAQMLSFDKLREMREHAWTCSSERARRELGFSPRYGLEEGMRDAVSWFVGRGL
jgi:dihydroflavonol-4-reductase